MTAGFDALRTAFLAGFLAGFLALFLVVRFAAAFFGLLLAPFLAAFFRAFIFFFATSASSSLPGLPETESYNSSVPNPDEERVIFLPRPGGFTLEIRPLIRTRRGRVRVALLAAAVLGAAFFGAARLEEAWETGLKKGEFADLPLPLLASLTLAVGVSTPLALVGLAALAFAEETVEAGRDALTIRTTAFEKTRVRRIPLDELECWRQTYLPLPPWWTWAVMRLAARWAGRLEAVAGAAGPREKKRIARLLAEATGKPLIDDWGREVGTTIGRG